MIVDSTKTFCPTILSDIVKTDWRPSLSVPSYKHPPRDALGMASGAPQNNSQMACGAEIPGFLDALLQDFPAPLSPESPLPWKAPGTTLSQEEVEAELAELAMGFLSSRNAPPSLAAALTHEAISHLLKTDLSEFRKLPRQEEEDDDEEEEKAPMTLLDAKGLARRFFNQLWEVCDQWQKQVPLTAWTPQRQWLVSIHAIRNTRRKMEDRHVFLPTFNQLFGLSRLQSGTTGVCALITGTTLHVAWLGDSQVILVQQGQVVKLMEPHKPERQDEKARIEALGGFVSFMDCWRVNGTLAVSRAIGDVFQKPYVSGEADAASWELTGFEDYLLLACDGFFDVVPHQEVTSLVHNHLVRQQGCGLHVAEDLVAAARERGSHDNITVMVVFLRDPQELLKSKIQGTGNSQADVRSQNLLSGFSEPETNTPQRS
ncbi:protein phosphatase 1F isoform X4 [Sciurus carolinensis]|uniref:protein phosphatase 1F isoform X4 n=1 Tax=Sciurus carolinensis TaxID=30640 RepID=UPI001FB33D8C|nr:protein phosphatase 1F isoform X4 [Sciurus carolinensis]